MRLLFIVPYTPTPIRTRPYNLLRTLARRGHAVTLATLWQDDQERAALEQLENQGIGVVAAHLTKTLSTWNCLQALPTSLPLQSVYCGQPALAASIQSTLNSQQYDIVHVEHLRGARYGLAVQPVMCNLKSATPVVWDSVDCISYLFQQAIRNSRSRFGRLVTRFELPRTRKYEAWLVNQFDRVLVTSPTDAAALAQLANAHCRNEKTTGQGDAQNDPLIPSSPCPPITVLPNGVDLEYFSPANAPREPGTIVFSGKMSYHANVTAALHLIHDILPLVRKERPDVQVQIVGQDPPPQVRKLATREPSCVTVTGRIPDLRHFLRRATLAVAPMPYGAGIQNKVLEAMACATPVVATSHAVSALQACPDEHVLVADEPGLFARQILRLLDDQDLQARIGKAGRRYVEQYHDWDRIVEQLESIYSQVVHQSDGPVVS